MLRYALLAGAVVMTAPAFAQTAPTAAQTAPAPTTTAPPSAPVADPMQAAPMQSAPAQSTPRTATPAAEPAATGDQVAQAVGGEFGTYDKDGNGTLSRSEFGAWMVALKTASDPATKAESPATKKWIGAAFAQADTDKSKSVSKTEITGFLSQGKS